MASVATGKKELSPPLPKGLALRVFDGESVAHSGALRRASCEKKKALGSAADVSVFFFFFSNSPLARRGMCETVETKRRDTVHCE